VTGAAIIGAHVFGGIDPTSGGSARTANREGNLKSAGGRRTTVGMGVRR